MDRCLSLVSILWVNFVSIPRWKIWLVHEIEDSFFANRNGK